MDHSKIPRDTTYWALCVPASCTSQEMLKSLTRHLSQVNARRNGTVRYVAHIDDEYCRSLEERPFTSAEIGFWFANFYFFFSFGCDHQRVIIIQDRSDQNINKTMVYFGFEGLKKSDCQFSSDSTVSDSSTIRGQSFLPTWNKTKEVGLLYS